MHACMHRSYLCMHSTCTLNAYMHISPQSAGKRDEGTAPPTEHAEYSVCFVTSQPAWLSHSLAKPKPGALMRARRLHELTGQACIQWCGTHWGTHNAAGAGRQNRPPHRSPLAASSLHSFLQIPMLCSIRHCWWRLQCCKQACQWMLPAHSVEEVHPQQHESVLNLTAFDQIT